MLISVETCGPQDQIPSDASDLPVPQRPSAPRLVLRRPLRAQPAHRGLRQRRPVSPQRQLEVAPGQPVQVQLRDQIPHLPRPPREQRQHPALEPLLQAPHPRPPDRSSPNSSPDAEACRTRCGKTSHGPEAPSTPPPESPGSSPEPPPEPTPPASLARSTFPAYRCP